MSIESNPVEFGNELPAGFRLEEFEIKSVLGSGGFGITYLARDVDLKRDVVVKENLPFQCAMRDSTRSVRPRTSSSGDRDQFEWALQSFLREAETLSRFDHPNIVRVLRRFEANNTAYFVMPYLAGKSLKQVIDEQVARDQGFTEQRLKDLLLPLLDALEMLHQEGVYHRDIKAANILLATGHRPILIDFGAARQVISEKSHTVVESAGYTPFEQLQSHGNVGPWSDIYALAGTFYTAIHGEPPPRASDRMRNDPIVCLAEQYAEHYSVAFLQALDWGLRVDERDRPQNVAEWREAFRTGVLPERAAKSAVPAKTTGETEKKAIDPAPATVKPKPEPIKEEDKRPFPVAFVAKIAGVAVGGALLIALVWHLMAPLFLTPGSLTVTADPANAVVKISGQAERPQPAEFPKLKVGTYQVVISAPGYDPVTRSVQIKEAQTFPWEKVQLDRAYGNLALTSVPPHASYHLDPGANNDAHEYHGSLPATLTKIPAGDYKLTLSSGDLHADAIAVSISSGQTTTSHQDLVKLGLAHGASPAVASALLGQSSPSQLSGADRKAYVDASHHVIDSYLQYHFFPQAAQQIAELKKLGENTQDLESNLNQKEQAYEKTTADQIRSLIASGRFGAAQSRIDMANDSLGKEAVDRLNGEFKSQLADHQKKESDAIDAAGNGDPAKNYPVLSAFVSSNPDDVNAQLALADLSRHMPPDHSRLSSELSLLRGINTEDVSADQSARIQDAQGHIQAELSTYDSLLGKLNEAKGDTSSPSARIAHLQARIAENQRRIAVNENVNTAVNAVTGLFGQRVHIETNADRQRAIDRDQAEIARLQASAQSSTSGTDAAQHNFDAFCQQVPW